MVWNTKLSWFVRVGGLVMPFSCKVHPFHEDVVAKLHVYVSYLSGTTRDLNQRRFVPGPLNHGTRELEERGAPDKIFSTR